MTTDLTKIENIVVSSIPITVYAVWNNKKNSWYRPYYTRHQDLSQGLWLSKEEAEKDIKITDYKIISINVMETIHPDLVAIYELSNSNWPAETKRMMILSKLRQLIELYIFRNKDMKEQLSETNQTN